MMYPSVFAPGTAEAVRLLDQGVPLRSVATQLGLSTDALQKRVRRYRVAVERGAVEPEGDSALLEWSTAESPSPGGAVPERAGGSNVLSRTVQAERVDGWEHSLMVTADHHFDHVDCDRELLRYQLEQAVERKAEAVAIGDIFCAMQGKMDRRASKVDLRPEYLVDGYLDAIVEDAAAWYAPFAPHLSLLTYGNHESKVASYTETDILRRFHRELQRAPGGQHVQLGAYAGWYVLDLAFPDGTVHPFRIRYHHGWGGGGPVTVGAIGAQRQRAATDCDAYLQGHIHEKWWIDAVVETVVDGRLVSRTVPQICAGPYKDEGRRGMGWHTETGKPLKPQGAVWLHIYYSKRQGGIVARAEGVRL